MTDAASALVTISNNYPLDTYGADCAPISLTAQSPSLCTALDCASVAETHIKITLYAKLMRRPHRARLQASEKQNLAKSGREQALIIRHYRLRLGVTAQHHTPVMSEGLAEVALIGGTRQIPQPAADRRDRHAVVG